MATITLFPEGKNAARRAAVPALTRAAALIGAQGSPTQPPDPVPQQPTPPPGPALPAAGSREA